MRSPLRVWLTVGPVALAAGGGALAIVLTSGHEENRVLVSIFGLLVGWAFVVAGLIARTRRPENATGILMLVVGFTFFVGALGDANNSVLFTIGVAFGAVFIGALVHLLLAYPSGRLQTQRERILVIGGYAAALLANAAPMLFDPTPADASCAECPENALLLTDNRTADRALTFVFEGLGFLILALAVVVLTRRWRGSSPAARRLLGPVLIAGGTTLGFFALTIVVFPISETAANLIGIGFVAGFIATPFVFLWGILRTRLTRLDVGTLLADSGETPTLVETQDALRDALRDPTAELVYRLDDPTGYFKVDSQRIRLEEVADDRAVTEIESTDGPIAAVMHDPALLEEPELLSRVCLALRLRLEKDRSVRALRISEYRSRALLDAIPDTMFRVARDGTVLDIHSHDPENVVMPPEEMIGTNLYDIPADVIARETMEERRVLVERAFETGEAQTQRYEINMPTGGHRFAETRIVPSGENEFVMIVRDVTEERLTASRSQALLEAIPDTMFRLTRDGVYLDYYTRTPEVLALPADVIIGSSIYDIPADRIAPEVIRERMALAERAFETGKVQTQEYEIRTPDGETMYSEARIVPSGDDEWVMMVRDVSDKRMMESRNRALLEALPDAVFRLTREGIYLDFRSPDGEKQGIDTQAYVGTSIRDALPPDVVERIMDAAERAFDTREVQSVEGELEYEGRTVYTEARIVPSGEDEFVMIVRDVTDRVVQQRHIETQNEFLGAMGDATTGLLCNLHLDGRIGHDSVNLPLRELAGYEQYEVDGGYFWEVFVAPEDRADAERVVKEVAAGGDPGEQQSRWLTKDGREVVVAWTCRPMPRITGEEPNLLVSGSDVTERVRHEERIQRERDYFGALFDATPSFICVVDHEGMAHSVNESMIELTGYAEEDIAHRRFSEVFSAPEDAGVVDTVIAAAAAGDEPGEQETTWVTRDGRRVLVAWTCTPLPERETARRLVISGTDVTERNRREEEQAALRRVAVAVARERRPEDVFQTVTEEAGRLLGGDSAFMMRYDLEVDEAVVVGYWRREDAVQDDTIIGRRVTLEGGPTSIVRRTGTAARFTQDDPIHPGWRERLQASRTSSIVTSPVLVSGRVWGAVSVSIAEGSFAPGTEERISQFTSLVSTALANAEAREELLASLRVRKQREDEQAALRRVAVAIASEHRPEDVFKTVTEEVGRVLGANRAHILRYDPQTEDAQIVGVWQDDDAEQNLLGRRIAVDQGPYRTIRELGRPIRYEIDSADVPPVLRARLLAEGVTSVVVAPIMVSGDLWGAVSISVSEGSLAAETEELIGPFTSLVATALANAEARAELLASRARIVEAGDAERRRLERNLHDGAQQRLVSLSLSLRLAQARLKSDVHAADEILSGASIELALALEELRELARGIHPAVLTDRGLGPALESLADRTPLPIVFDELPEERLPTPIEAAAFYVVSEALANVTKYAEASSVNVRVAQENGYAVVEVADNGVGGADPSGGSGLRGLSDRVAALEGRLAIVSPPGAGTRIRAEIPFG
jgi:PAS domain S-box-containing protein